MQFRTKAIVKIDNKWGEFVTHSKSWDSISDWLEENANSDIETYVDGIGWVLCNERPEE